MRKLAGPLEGIRILDFTHVWQGPVATQMLADFGADVIKIERPGMGDWSRGYGPWAKGLSLAFAGLNRNKRSVVIDLRTQAGKEIMLKLVRTADVLVHNFRPDVMERLGLDYETLKEINPQLIYAQSSGWGDEGPYVERGRGGHALMAAATAGLFVRLGPDELPIPGSMSVDYPAGMLLAQGILLALLARERTGRGQRVSTDLLSAAFFAHAWGAPATLNPELVGEKKREGLGATEAAIRKSWRTKDGLLELSPVFSPDALRDISVAMGLGDLSTDPRFAALEARVANADELNAILEERFQEKTTQEWIETLEPQGVLCAEIKTFAEAAQDPQVLANKMVVEMEHPRLGTLRLLGTPIRLSETPASLRRVPPDLGEHTEEVLKGLGYSPEDIARLRGEKVIA